MFGNIHLSINKARYSVFGLNKNKKLKAYNGSVVGETSSFINCILVHESLFTLSH